MPRSLEDTVVVVTGASSGIGRATAYRFARHGAAVVLAARGLEALAAAAREVERLGGRALAVPTDVSDERQVQTLARRALEEFGRIDVWVNNAAVAAFGGTEEMPTEIYRRVLETNVMGSVHGTRAVLPIFREQQGGILILVDSLVAQTPQPFAAAYVMSKAAVRRFADCVRMELSLDGESRIRVCTVLPAAIDTPLFQHAANYAGRAAKALNPTYPADDVADAIVQLARAPKREVVVGRIPWLASLQHSVAPTPFEWIGARQFGRDQFRDEPIPPTEGNLFEPAPGTGSVSGGWPHTARTARRALAGLSIALPAALLLWSHRAGLRQSLRHR